MALGADRARIVRQMFTESLVLALAGGGIALVVSAWLLDLLLRVAPPGIPRLKQVRIDGGVMAFTLLIAMAAGMIFGLAPAFRWFTSAARCPGRVGPRPCGRRAATCPAGARGRQIALSLMLLIGATLLIQSFARIQRVDVGFRSAAVLTVDRIELPPGRAAAAASAAFFESLVRALRTVPGVESAAVTLGLPLDPRARFFVDESTSRFPVSRRFLRRSGPPPRCTSSAATTSPSLACRSSGPLLHGARQGGHAGRRHHQRNDGPPLLAE